MRAITEGESGYTANGESSSELANIVDVDSALHKVASDVKLEGGGWLGH